MCPNKHLERRTARERERKRERERSKGTSWREQGGQARRQTEDKEHTVPRKHPERTATCESEVERRVRKQMGLGVLSPKPPERRTLSNGERSEERETSRFL